MRIRTVVLAGILPAMVANASDWKKTLEESLTSNYELTKTGGDRNRVTKEGTVLTIRKDNINGDVAASMVQMINKVMPDGSVVQGSGSGNGRVFKVGDKVYVYKIDVKDDAVVVDALSKEMFEVLLRGSTRQTRYKAAIHFEFPKGTLQGMEPAAVKKVIDAAIGPE
jgi:hypothetical protein